MSIRQRRPELEKSKVGFKRNDREGNFEVFEYDGENEEVLVLKTRSYIEAENKAFTIYGRSKNGRCKQFLIKEDGKLLMQGMNM